MSSNIYESRRLLDEYLLFHYGNDEEVLPWGFGPQQALGFATRTVTELLDVALLPTMASALDLGCAVGRSSFELAKAGCATVLGIDYSQAFAHAAAELNSGAVLTYSRHEEGGRYTQLVAAVPAHLRHPGVSFEQGDAMDLRRDLPAYDVVHAANLLCRLSHPERLLERLPSLVKPGGQLLLATPCTWLEDFTPSANWPAGGTLEWLRSQLAGSFRLVMQRDLPFLIRETARKYQWTVALGTRWERVI